MGNPEEPEYQVYDYTCPHCGHEYAEAGSVRKHPDFQACPSCAQEKQLEHGEELLAKGRKLLAEGRKTK